MTNQLPPLRATITEAATALRISKALLYQRIAAGEIASHHDGRRAFISTLELQRYVNSQRLHGANASPGAVLTA